MKCLGMSFYSKWMHPSKDCLQTFDALMARFETRRSFSGLYGKQAPAGPPHPSDRVPFDQGGGQQDAFGQRFVAPHPGGLASASGTAVTPDGLISVSWSNNGRGFELRVNAPRSYRVDLILPEEVRGHSSVTVNGEPVIGREFEFHEIKAPLTVKTQK